MNNIIKNNDCTSCTAKKLNECSDAHMNLGVEIFSIEKNTMNITSPIQYDAVGIKYVSEQSETSKQIINNKRNKLYMNKNYTKNILLPVGFDLDEHLRTFPPIDNGFPSKFKTGKAYYFLGLLSSIGANNNDLIDEDGCIPIHMGTIRNHIKNISQYIEYLIYTEIVECNRHYIAKNRSRGYKWASKFDGSEFCWQSVQCSYQHVNENVISYTQETMPTFITTHTADSIVTKSTGLEISANVISKDTYPYLSYWYDQKKLAISSSAQEFAYKLQQEKMEGKLQWDENKNTGKLKDPCTQYRSVMYNINKIQTHDYSVSIDSNVHRLYSVLTNIQSRYRNFITYDNKQLVNIDIKNSQPYIACLILNPTFWQNEPVQYPKIRLNNLYENIQERLKTPEKLSIMIDKFFDKTDVKQFDNYIQIVSKGNLYEEIVNVSKKQLNIIEREDAKQIMLHVLFSHNRGRHRNPKIHTLKQIFNSKLFPEVAKLFKLIKTDFRKGVDMEKQHNRLSCLLQSIESTIILHHICPRIWQVGQGQIPIFTIHDSIVTTIEHVGIVEQIMRETLTEYIGVSPSLKRETWDIDNVLLE
jgi:hypothetical protein